MDISYIINELGEERENYLGAVSPPIMQSVNYCFPTVAGLSDALAAEMDIPFYTRGHNPTVAILRKKLAALEAAEECIAFSSGSAAATAAIMSCIKAGDHVVCVQKPYSWTYKLLANYLVRFGVEVSFIDGTVAENYRAAIREYTTLFVLESPNSMTFEMQDMEEVVKIAKEKGITTVMDNSFATPLNQQPLTWGIDLVFHSATKYLNGHSDTVAGVVCGSHAKCKQIFESEYMTFGATLSANDAWLILRGLRTLPLRMERTANTTPKILAFLEQHEKIEKVYSPFSSSFPQKALTAKYLKQATGLFTILLKADPKEQVETFCNALRRFLIATSWGGYESLVYPMLALHTSANYSKTTLPWNMIRLYVGLEEAEVLIEDLAQALEKI